MNSEKFLWTIKDEYVDLDKYDILKTQRIVDLLEIVIKEHKSWNDSFVIWLQWSWWSWKTSVLKTLEKRFQGKNKFIIVNFCPWLYNPKCNIFNKFFDKISDSLSLNTTSDRESLDDKFLIYKYQKELSEDWLEQSKNFFWFLKQSLNENYGYIFWLISIFFPFFNFFNIPLRAKILFIFIELIFICTAVYLFYKSYKIRRKLWRIISKYKPIEELKNEIDAKLLSWEKDKKLLVFIDDLDRLENKRIWDIFQIIKSTWNFKNTIYLISYDKQIVEPILNKFYWWKDYLGKIVQYEVNLPKITNDDITSLFYKYIENFISKINENFTTSYEIRSTDFPKFWKFLSFQAWNEVFKTVRDIKRFFNELYADFSIMHSNFIEKEIDIIDFVLIEIIKFADNWLYNLIYQTFSYVFFYNNWFWFDSKLDEFYQRKFETQYEKRLPLIYQLFPIETEWKFSKVQKRSILSISNSDRFNDYFKIYISWFSNTDYNKLCDLINLDMIRWKEYIRDIFSNHMDVSFLNVLSDKIQNIFQYNRLRKKNMEINDITLIFKILFTYDEEIINVKKHSNRWSSIFDFLFNSYMVKLSENNKVYESEFYELLNWFDWKNKLYHIMEYVHINLNQDENYLFEVVKDIPIIQSIKITQSKLWFEKVKNMFDDFKEIFFKKFQLNQLHKDAYRELLFTNWKRLWWITSEQIYNYCVNNDLVKDVLSTIRSNSFHIRNFTSHSYNPQTLKEKIFPYFDKNEQLKILVEFEWTTYENILKNIIES